MTILKFEYSIDFYFYFLYSERIKEQFKLWVFKETLLIIAVINIDTLKKKINQFEVKFTFPTTLYIYLNNLNNQTLLH